MAAAAAKAKTTPKVVRSGNYELPDSKPTPKKVDEGKKYRYEFSSWEAYNKYKGDRG